MRVLVTGGAGYLGTVLLAHLQGRGDTVLCLDNLSAGSITPLLPYFRCSERFRFVHADIRDRGQLVDSLRQVDAIVHLAAVVGYPACKLDPQLSRSVNVEGARLLDGLRSPDQMLILVSTGSVYGAVTEEICTEETPPNPLTEYGATKLAAERLLLDTGNVVVLRFATAFGLSPQMRLDLLINDFCYRAVHERHLILYESEFRRTFLHVDDIARAILHVLDHYSSMRDQTFNCGDERLAATKLDVARMIREQFAFYLHQADVGHDEDQRNYRVSYEKLHATGFEASTTLEQGIREMLTAFPYFRIPSPYFRGR